MASYDYTFTSGDTITPTKLNDARTVSDIVNADIKSDAAIAHTKLANITAGQVLLGNGSNVPTATALSGDVTVNSSGVTAIGSGVIVDADVNASAAIAGTKIAPAFGAQDITVSTANRSITNTGNFALSFGTNNTERVRITQDGILSLRPVGGEGGQLEIVNPDNATVGMFIDVSSADTARIFTASATTGDLQIGQLSGTGGITRFFTAGTERMRIDASGNVWIGTTSAAEKFEVVGNIAARATSATGSAGFYSYINGVIRSSFSTDMAALSGNGVSYLDAQNTLIVRDTNAAYAERMRIDASGNVGIGTTTMSQRLNVEGSIHLGPGSSFRYISTTSEHLAFVKKAGGPFDFYFRKTDDGLAGGANSTDLFNIKDTGQVRFVPLSADPAGAETGDVYYNSSTNKLRVYNGSWVDLH